MLELIKELIKTDWAVVLTGVVLAILILKALCDLWDWILKRFGLETKAMRQIREDHELLTTTSKNLAALQKKHTKDEEEFRTNLESYMKESREDRKLLHSKMDTYSQNRASDRQQSLSIQKDLTDSVKGIASKQNDRDKKIKDLTDMFLDREIDSMRWDILDFASSLSNGRKYNRESYDHILRIYNKYEKILSENQLENGLVEESIEYIREVYRDGLKQGTVK